MRAERLMRPTDEQGLLRYACRCMALQAPVNYLLRPAATWAEAFGTEGMPWIGKLFFRMALICWCR
uniref:Uncharacterized protein n=1 Tax=Setaria viridis TaxID=4556 RepID=A0A4U6TI23_SETVI|nr:hypothetical protein SEVIR_8G217850v2 [Setaria viridis]